MMADVKFKCHFNKAQYLSAEPVIIKLPEGFVPEQISVTRLEAELEIEAECSDGEVRIIGLPDGAYGIKISAGGASWEGAFDIVGDRREALRYGFLSDFGSEDADYEDVEWMRDRHINAVQFYDWMYRHDCLIPPCRRYEDPMGRDMDFRAIQQKLIRCTELGMRPIAYGAVYAATLGTYELHPDWAVYTMDGTPMKFAGWLYFMNVSAGCGWVEHLMGEYRKAIEAGFAGIHMDTYGFPKRVWDSSGRTVELADEFPELINRAAREVRAVDASAGVLFNAVNNWPIDTVAAADSDAVYIEVWPPNDTYLDLYLLIRRAKELSGKNVVLAAYMKPFKESDVQAAERSFRLTWAAISASGGTQLALGEHMGMLCDSYYVDYARLTEDFSEVVQKYCDFLVRYSELLYNDRGTDISKTASGGINEDVCFSGSCDFSTDGSADSVWTIIRESEKRTSINLVNLAGNSCLWDQGKAEPRFITDINIRLRLDRPVSGVYMASPDFDELGAQKLDFTFQDGEQGRVYSIDVPELRYWAVIWIQLE